MVVGHTIQRLTPLLLLLAGLANGLPGGAPTSACSTMQPRHGSHRPQGTPAPYTLSTRPAEHGQDWQVVRLAGSADRQFSGVMLQARRASDGGGAPLGRFQNTDGVQLIDCGGHGQNGVTHRSPTLRDTLEVLWVPENVTGEVRFVATVLADFRTWWEGVTSEPVVVTATEGGAMSAALQESKHSSVEDAYAGCFIEYGCFGAPAECESSQTCDVLFTYVAAQDGIKMGIMAKQDDHYAAVGISEDNRMKSDGVIFCVNTADSQPQVYYGYNADFGRGSTIKSDANPTSVSDLQSWEKDGYFMCSFTQDLDLVIPNEKTFNLEEEHYLMVATGTIDASLAPSYHSNKRAVTASGVNLTDTSQLQTAGVPALIKAHGAFMLIAWVGTAGIGILSAQFFRGTWVGKKALGTDIWFTIHRSLMVLTALCTWLGFAFIVIEEKELSFDHNHSIIGFTVFLLTLLQVMGAAVRPKPDARLRPVFAWSHRLVGVSAYLLALTALLLAQQLPDTRLPRYWFWILVSAAVVHLIVSLTLLVIDQCLHPKTSASLQVLPDSAADSKTEAPGSPLRKAVLGFYMFTSLGFVVALITVLVAATD